MKVKVRKRGRPLGSKTHRTIVKQLESAIGSKDLDEVLALVEAHHWLSTWRSPDFWYTLLHYSAWHYHAKLAKRLLELGANVNAKDVNGRVPLHDAMKSGCLAIVDLLMAHNCIVDVKDRHGDLPWDGGTLGYSVVQDRRKATHRVRERNDG